jgi:hypothetical protein
VPSTFLLLLETLDFKFVLKPKDGSQCIFEEGPNRSLGCANNELEMRTVVFKLNEKGELDCKIWAETEMLSVYPHLILLLVGGLIREIFSLQGCEGLMMLL